VYLLLLSLFYYIAVTIKSKQPLAKQQPSLKSLTEKSLRVWEPCCACKTIFRILILHFNAH